MSLAVISLGALILALALSSISTVNVGFLAIVLAWLVGVYGSGQTVEQVIAWFPSSLFLTLVGLTLLFSMAQVNGTLDRITHKAVRRAAGSPGIIPFVFFFLTNILASVGPGHIAATALMAPLAMAAAGRYRIPAFLMAIMVANGASSGSLSPIAPTGVVVEGITMKLGMPDVRWAIYWNNLIAHVAIAWTGYLVLGGWRLLRVKAPAEGVPHQVAAVGAVAASHLAGPSNAGPSPADRSTINDTPFTWRQWLTCAVIVGLVVSVIFLKLNVGLAAFAGAVILTFARAADETAAVKAMPWGVIMMVSGVTLLVTMVDKNGGMALFADFLAKLATPSSATAVAAFFSGAISIYSSTIAVVLPTLIPTVNDLIKNIGGGDALAIISSMIVGGHVVDVSPLSTLGALCMASAPPGTNSKRLFNQLLAWGISMTFVAAVVCWVIFR
ncbi:MAG TPA: SLC13 family permease [Vicinamibacterales bacterium]|nr:SLC13 family permease [Vicinamibacterales bacterium]